MGLSELAGWFALALVPLTALAGWVLRRHVRGRFAVRMRAHFVFGYAALAFAAVHLALSMGGAMNGANATGISFATVAFTAMAIQAFLGTNLQSPGVFRAPLRRWHIAMFLTVLVLALGHVVLQFSG